MKQVVSSVIQTISPSRPTASTSPKHSSESLIARFYNFNIGHKLCLSFAKNDLLEKKLRDDDERNFYVSVSPASQDDICRSIRNGGNQSDCDSYDHEDMSFSVVSICDTKERALQAFHITRAEKGYVVSLVQMPFNQVDFCFSATL